jgi:hypothetical protein
MVGFRARVADEASDLAGGHVERCDQGLRAMALVFVFAPLDLAGLHGQARRGALQGLHAAHLVDRDGADALSRRFGRLQIDRADVGAFALEFRIGLGREPASHAMGLKGGFF